MWSLANFSPILHLTIGGKDASDLLGVMTSFKLKLATKKAGEATFSFRDDDGLFLEDSRFFPNTEWSFRFGFVDDLSPVFKMLVRNFEPEFAMKRTLTVTLFDGSSSMAQNSSSKNWGAVPSSTIAKQLARKYNLKPEVTDSKDAPKKAIIQPGDLTDIQFLRDLAAEIDYEVIVNNERLVYRPKPYKEDAVGVLIYAEDPTERSYVKSFKPSVKSLGAVKASGAATADKNKGSGKAAADTTSKVQLEGASGKATVLPPSQSQNGTKAPAVGNAGGLAKAARSQMLDKVNEAKSTHPLTPSLVKGKSYVWRGVGKQLGGKWYLQEVTHEISGTSSKTDCDWKRNDGNKAASSNSTKKNADTGAGKQVQLVGDTGKATVVNAKP